MWFDRNARICMCKLFSEGQNFSFSLKSLVLVGEVIKKVSKFITNYY